MSGDGRDFFDSGDDFYQPPPGAGRAQPMNQDDLFNSNISAFGAPPPTHAYGSAAPAASPFESSPYGAASYGVNGPAGGAPSPTSAHFGEVPVVELIEPVHESEYLQEPAAPPKGNYHPWNVEYYRFLFDLSDRQLGERCLRAFSPYPANFIDRVRANPDLYGPFWITTTMVLLLFFGGNIAGFLDYAFNTDCHADNGNLLGSSSIRFLTIGAGVIYIYQIVVPLLLWAASACVFKFELSILDCVCIYGYGLIAYVPATVLAMLPLRWLRIAWFGLAYIVSSAFLISNFFRELLRDRERWHFGAIVCASIIVLNAILALVLWVFFWFTNSSCTPDKPKTHHNTTMF